tara:strand:+ start:838 stop:1359 length:522 start_codon:yes stop_codon:yes gene_type:complete
LAKEKRYERRNTMSVSYGQSGYVGTSRSVRSYEALQDGKLVPSEMVKHLRKKKLFKGVKASDLNKACQGCEWHHVGTYAQAVLHLDMFDIYENRQQIRHEIKARQSFKPTEFIKVVEWTEWEGRSRNYMKPVKYQAKCRVTRKGGTMVTLQIIEKGKPSGEPFRKKESNLRYL